MKPLKGERTSESGAVAVEFALIAPVLIAMLTGIVAYGGYFWTAHAVQQVANDAARAALSGLTATERSAFAAQVVAEETASYAYLEPASAQSVVTGDASTIKVELRYDASRSPFWSLGALAPMPSSTVVRTATVRLGGY